MDPQEEIAPGPLAQRAGDAEREHAAERLRAAGAEGRLTVEELEQRVSVALAARTRPELEALLADLGETGGLDVPAAGDQAALARRPQTRMTISIMGGTRRSGVWRPARNGLVLDVMGGSRVDLTDAELVHPVTNLRVISIMGGAHIRVPEGVEVHVAKLGIMGGTDVRLGDERPPPGAPVVTLRLLSIMGMISVRRGRGRGRGRDAPRQSERRELDP